jgi:hypothetical protein
MDSSCSCLMTRVAIWFFNLTHLLSFVWFLWNLAWGFSVCLTWVGGHRFSHSMNTHDPFMRFDGFLDSFSCGLGWVRRHVSRVSFIGPRPCFCDAFICSSHIVPLRSRRFFLMIALVLFLELVFQHASKGDSNTSFLNQILHLANPQDKLSTFVLCPSLGFPSIYWLTL